MYSDVTESLEILTFSFSSYYNFDGRALSQIKYKSKALNQCYIGVVDRKLADPDPSFANIYLSIAVAENADILE